LDWKKFFDSLGMNGSRWQWRMMRYERDLKKLLRGRVSGEDLRLSRLILYLNVGLFVLMIVHGLLAGIGPRALFSPPTELLLAWGGQYWPVVLGHGQWWRCLTYAFTHGGVLHLAFNMLVLYQVGPLIEGQLGPARFVILYTFATLTATFAALLWYPSAPIVGASGALFGLIGFAVVYFHRLGQAGTQLRNFMLQWAVFAFVFGLLVGADNAGHFGGAVGGALLGAVFPPYRRQEWLPAGLIKVLGWVCGTANVVALLSMFFWIATG